MSRSRAGAAVGPIQTLFDGGTLGGLSDGQLLERFLDGPRDASEPAFAVLVDRHGPMVLRVCRSVLRRPDDIQDAFQATFLALAVKAGSIRRRERLPSWLHGAACRVSLAARAAALRRQRHEQQAAAQRGLDTRREDGDAPDRADLAAVIHEELGRLPATYRTAIVLCDLEGQTHEQAATALGWPVGTVHSRLVRGRDRLRTGLIRRGVAPAAIAVAMAHCVDAHAAIVAPALATTTARLACLLVDRGAAAIPGSVAALSRGALGRVFWVRVRMAAVALTALALGLARVGWGGQDAPPVAAQPVAKRPAHAPASLVEVVGRTAYNPDTLTKIRTRFEALVVDVPARLGQVVKKGDPLVTLRSGELAAAKTDFQKKYVQWQHDLKLYNIREELIKTGSYSHQMWVDTQNDEKKSRLDYMLARDRLKILKVDEDEIDRLKADPSSSGPEKDQITLVAPCDGVVVERAVVPQTRYNASATLLVIAPLDRLWVWAEFPESARPMLMLNPGLAIEVAPFDEPPGQEPIAYRGTLEYVAVEVVSETRFMKVRGSFANPGGRLRSGMEVRLNIKRP